MACTWHWSQSYFCVLFLAILFRVKAATTTEEKIKQHGYPVEMHKIVTEDGYVLVLERIPHNRQSTEVGPPVLLLHGLFSISISFTFNNSSLGYILSDAGYDVWLCNNRGVGPSKKHTRLTDNDTRYWDFSIEDVSWLISELPNVVDTYNIPSQSFGHLSFVIHPDVKNLLNDYIVKLFIYSLFFSFQRMLLDVMANYPHPMSTKILKHYLQSMTGKFSHFDYGPNMNLVRYSSRVPPKYNLSQILTPTIVIHSEGDTLVPPKDVSWLINELPNVVDTYNIPSQSFGHLSFVIHPDVKNLLNDYIVAFLI
ncbi:gastric triacylglycerol lipase-like [Diaphorina citri]|uniref:Gastric triacylglycerol lipase-like n=1 Tax=Diaphorina citri TaxID=121845 RepID=A0A3Q0ISS3_DIACI|nr:gastric triacylglycerol lipase-like [Diaphorina citri]